MAYERKDENRAYQFLLPLLDTQRADTDLVKILLALAYKLGEKQKFLSLIPHTMSSKQFLPLAFRVAYEEKNEEEQKNILARILSHSNWQLPPVDMEFKDSATFAGIVTKAIVEGQLEQLIIWLRAYIRKKPLFLTPYIELAKVLEERRNDIDGAFNVLRDRVEKQLKVKDPDRKIY